MKPEISVIIPVYNSENTIIRCLKSIKDQNYRNYEVIIVDDGSQDRTVSIVKAFCQNDTRFKLYLQENGGPSSARNHGLSEADGEYVCFIDSDDLVDSNLLDESYKIINTEKTDMVFYKYRRRTSSGEYIDEEVNFPEGRLTVAEALKALLEEKYQNYIWRILFSKTLLEGIRFKNYSFGEDIIFLYEALLRANSVFFLNKMLYTYNDNYESLSKRYSASDLIAICDILKKRSKIIGEKYPILRNEANFQCFNADLSFLSLLLRFYPLDKRLKTQRRLCLSNIRKVYPAYYKEELTLKKRFFYSFLRFDILNIGQNLVGAIFALKKMKEKS